MFPHQTFIHSTPQLVSGDSLCTTPCSRYEKHTVNQADKPFSTAVVGDRLFVRVMRAVRKVNGGTGDPGRAEPRQAVAGSGLQLRGPSAKQQAGMGGSVLRHRKKTGVAGPGKGRTVSQEKQAVAWIIIYA